jgi:lipooligosaccharide transport system ATP-binding protein
VLELTGAGADTWGADAAPDAGVRIHRVGDLTLLYTAKPRTLLERLDASDQRYLHRPANLDDVFLKLTGHDLRD